MISQGASKVLIFSFMFDFDDGLQFCVIPDWWKKPIILKQVNISLVVHDSEAKQCVQALHSAFFESGFLPEVNDILQDDSVAHSNGTVYRH